MKRAIPMILLFALMFSSCATQGATKTEQTAIADSIMQQIEIKQTDVAFALTPTITPTASQTPTITLTPSPTSTATPTITPTWIKHPKGKPIFAPILLYHHIRDIEKPGRYDVSPATFETQLQYLKQWGYTSITIGQLVDALKYSDPLPEKPVIITFDDGALDVYQNAFPIMQKLGFVGTFYIVSNRLRAIDFVNVTQLREMIAAGWEIGSHSHSHKDLTSEPQFHQCRGIRIEEGTDRCDRCSCQLFCLPVRADRSGGRRPYCCLWIYQCGWIRYFLQTFHGFHFLPQPVGSPQRV